MYEFQGLNHRLKAVLAAGLLGISVLTAACGSVGQTAEKEQAPKEQVQLEKTKEAAQGRSTPQNKDEAKQGPKICLADDDFDNLQLTDAQTPVYDKYTLAQRWEKGLTTERPALKPFFQGKVAYLTFDDGPDNKNTPAILDILKAEGVRATFYVQGAMAETYPEVIKRIYQENHALGNHSYNHRYDELYVSHESFIGQMEHTDEVLQSIVGVRPLIIRAPGGAFDSFDENFWSSLRIYSYAEHDWNVSSGDAALQPLKAEQLVGCVADGLKYDFDAAIILMHSTEAKSETVKALPGIIRLLRERGYSFGVITPMTPKPWG